MPTLTALDYERAAEEYLQSLPLEHFMEATPHATQREITVQSLALLKVRRPNIQYFNELLVQYLLEGRLRQVVPDNMLIISSTPCQAVSNYALELEGVPLFMCFDYVSPLNKRKEYENHFKAYEQHLMVPYYLVCEPEKHDFCLYRHDGQRYIHMERDTCGRCFVEELKIHVGLKDGLVRYWHEAALLELPAEMQQRLDQVKAEIHRIESELQRLQQISQVLDLIRRQVEERARKAGRQDILDRLPGTTDVARLEAWLRELG